MTGLAPTVLVVATALALAVRLHPAAAVRRPDVGCGRSVGSRHGRRGRRQRSSRRPASDVDALLGVLDDVSRSVRTGSSLTTAVERALRGRTDVLDDVGTALASGRSLPLALAAAPAAGPDATLVVHALTISARTGGPSVAALERAAAVLRERRTWRAERRAQAAQARLGASIMTVVPVGFAAWSAVGSERVRVVYATSPVALVLAVAGCCLNAAGWWWMRRITDGAVR